ncbi:FecR family protein [Alcaligenes faecalis]|uniref:FecR family protein n=1 Tax=Alcaligenes faecalis TaxID=511 RepID=UPI001EF151A2|nr:DUF4880 domain-containing protein [Alcaligenes faecalis]ULH06447.1 DUF4880 domain-containing protein [Alcaligenes faecalis]
MSPSQTSSDASLKMGAQELSLLRQQAQDWAVKLKAGQPTNVDVAAFHAWRNQSDAHAWAWKETCKDWQALGQAAQVYERRYAGKLPKPERFRRDRRFFIGATASALGTLAVVGMVRPPLGMWPSWSEWQADYRTGKGEQRALALTERLKVSLNTQTAVSIDNSSGPPIIALIAGEAAIDSQSTLCVIHAASGRLSVNDGGFEVRHLGADRVRVRCLLGSGQLQHSKGTVSLAANDEVTYDAQQLGDRQRLSMGGSDWRQGMVVFDNLPLAEAIEEINRYRPGRVVLMNNNLSERRFTAKFQIHALDDAIDLMERVLGVKARRAGDLVILT